MTIVASRAAHTRLTHVGHLSHSLSPQHGKPNGAEVWRTRCDQYIVDPRVDEDDHVSCTKCQPFVFTDRLGEGR